MSEGPNEPVRLSYEPPRKLTQQEYGTRALTGVILTGIVSMAFFPFAFAFSYGAQWSTTTLLVIVLIYVAALNWIAVRLYRSLYGRPWAAGIWTGLMLTVLIEGTCFLINAR